MQHGCCEFIGMFSFGTCHLLAWDTFRCHVTPRVNDVLNRAKVDRQSVIIPCGCTKLIQAPDVSWNRPIMKEYLREMYDNWLAENEHQMTLHGNNIMNAPSMAVK